MNVDDVTGRDLVACMAATLDAAIDAYPELVIPQVRENDPHAGELDPDVFRTRVLKVAEDARITDGHATLDVELTDAEGVGRVFRLTLTAKEVPS